MATSATFDGQSVFGQAVKIQHVPKASAVQVNAFFGVNGVLNLYAGTRGRTFFVTGCFVGANYADCVAAEALFRTFQDNNAYVLVDNFGRSWENVVFRGEIQVDDMGPRPKAGGGFAWAYKLILEGLS